ncbi:MAG: type II/IV secretion system ATPase subunit [Candidatus Thermoplasmatota archaeon]|nr:type II/IV secretion system ATPase subunit [Candidatus Thermoplasmatota archaeon]
MADKGSGKRKAGFWELIRNSSVCWEKPGFSGSWVELKDIGNDPADSRENRYLRTELFSSGGPQGRLYRIAPYEYSMDGSNVETVKAAIDEMQEAKPPQEILDDEKRLRAFTEAAAKKIMMRKKLPGDANTLSRICAQYSTGYGVLEHLLRDERVQDIYIDSPPGNTPVYVSLGGGMQPGLEGTYPTNIHLSISELERIVSILRYHSDRPFSEASPTLECDMDLYNARATAVGPPLSPAGISIAIRKHSHDPWTIPGLIRAGSITPMASGFLDLAMDGRATMLVAGPRGAGKTSLLGAMLFEVDRGQRIILLEDTPELPADHLREQGYKVLPLIFGEGKGSSPEKALRTALRLGESVIVMGEVRGPETRILYEAMSAGTAGSSVLGTFHADSAKAVFKRVVDDMGVTPGSFMSTDLVIVAGLVQPHGRKIKLRRVVQIAEVVKDERPGTFRDLFLYDPVKDMLVATEHLRSSGIVSRIASLWGWKPQNVIAEIELRGRVFARAIELLGEEEAGRSGSAARISESFDRARERMLDKGAMNDHDRFLKSWEKELSRLGG